MAKVEGPTTRDEVIEEVRRIKRVLAERFHFDVEQIVQDARSRQDGSGRVILTPPAREQNPPDRPDRGA